LEHNNDNRRVKIHDDIVMSKMHVDIEQTLW